MLRVTALLLIAITAALATIATTAEAKGPPERITISGGDLASEVVIERSELSPIDQTGYFDSNGTSYAATTEIRQEMRYAAKVYSVEGGSGQLQQFLSSDYFPANGHHPALLSDDGGIWRAQPTFAALLDTHISSALAVASEGASSGDSLAPVWYIAPSLALGLGALFVTGALATRKLLKRHPV